MASSKSYLDFVLEQLSDLEAVSYTHLTLPTRTVV